MRHNHETPPAAPSTVNFCEAAVSLLLAQRALYPDWHTLTAANGDEALQVVAGTPPDVAILDFNMPGMDGLTLASLLRERHPDLRIGILTANVQDAIRQRASSLDCVFIPKPATEAKIRGFVSPDPD